MCKIWTWQSLIGATQGLIVQLDSCLISLDQQQGPAAHSRICQLMEAYVRLICASVHESHKCSYVHIMHWEFLS